MNKDQLAKAWATVSVALLLFTVDSWLRIQGLDPIFGSELPHTGRRSAALFALVITSGMIWFQVKIANWYLSQCEPGPLLGRFPVAFFKTIDLSLSGGKHYQRFFFLVFHVLPLFALVHFYRVILGSKYYDRSLGQSCENTAYGFWSKPPTLGWEGNYRLGSCDGISFYPPSEPWILTIVFAASLILSFKYFYRLLGRKR